MPSEVEKLLNLLAEAREYIDIIGGPAGKRIVARIDAALAEPVVDDDIDADLRMHKEDRLRLRTESLKLTRERDKARAEVERLRSLKPIGTYSLDWNHEQERMTVARAAYQRGAESMREAAARECWRASDELADIPDMASEQGQAQLCATRIRALPVPEDKP